MTSGLWSDTSTHGDKYRKQIVTEGALFFKDDYKIARSLTLNLGLRWEFTGSPYIDGGFTSAVIDEGYGAFGPTRTAQSTLDAFNNDPFSIWLEARQSFPDRLRIVDDKSVELPERSCAECVAPALDV